MKKFLNGLGRKCEIVNLDFANDKLSYNPAIDIRELISLENVMNDFNLGPNGGLIYCMEFLLENASWLIDELLKLDTMYILFDFPGQVSINSLYTIYI